MAARRYGYYLKGNKIAIIEQSESTSSGYLAVAHCSISGHDNRADCEAAGGQWIPGSYGSTDNYGKYTSPTATIQGGLEIEYSYAPIYNIQSTGEGDKSPFIAWGSDGSNLVLFARHDYSQDTDISHLTANEWIYVEGSGRWSGLHQVKTAGTNDGVVVLKTKCSLKMSKFTCAINYGTDVMDGHGGTDDIEIEEYKNLTSNRNTRYIFIEDSADPGNGGLLSLTDNSTYGQLTANKHFIGNLGGHSSTPGYQSRSSTMASSGDNPDTVTIYNAFKEDMTVYENIEVMQGADVETFELDLTRYQANALVYYVKAKMSEDARDIEGREYFMREFTKQIEKEASAKKLGNHRVQGFWGMIK